MIKQAVESGDTLHQIARLEQHQGKRVLTLTIVGVGFDQGPARRKAARTVTALEAVDGGLQLLAC